MNLLTCLPNYPTSFLSISITIYNWNLISADKEDNKFSDCAIAAAADYIITEDSHFNILKQIDFPKMNIIGADDFMKMIG